MVVIKFHEVSLLLPALQSPADDLVHFSSFAGLVVTLQLSVLSEQNAVSDKPLGIMTDVGLEVNMELCLNLLLCSVDSLGCVGFSALRISAYSVYVHAFWAVHSYALKQGALYCRNLFKSVIFTNF